MVYITKTQNFIQLARKLNLPFLYFIIYLYRYPFAFLATGKFHET